MKTKVESIRHADAVILVGDLTPNEQARVVSINNSSVSMGFGPNYNNVQRLSFSDCEKLFNL